MPILKSHYTAKGIFKNAHVSTIYAAKLRVVKGVKQKRERLQLSDGDFMDLDWSFGEKGKRSSKLALIFHGLEGHAQRPYMLGMAKILNSNGYDCIGVNLRGCSGEMNRVYASYHSGATNDVDYVVQHVVANHAYDDLYLVGFSLGGNLVLKYLGEKRKRPDRITGAVAISVPVNLKASLDQLEIWHNWVYRWNFLRALKSKYKEKMKYHPDKMSSETLSKITSLEKFDDMYTAPANGFLNAMDYYAKSSSLDFLPNIDTPTLLLNAKNDTFLDECCFPIDYATTNRHLYLETPSHGGHVGFVSSNNIYYSEQETVSFFANL